MKKYINIIAIFTVAFVCMSAATASAQISTSYGHRYESRNLRFTEAEKVHTEVTVGGHAAFGGYSSYGADLQVTRVYTPTKAFGWRWGGLASIDNASDYGATSDVLAILGLRFGNKVYLGIDALAGAGQLAYHDYSWRGEADFHNRYSSMWRVKAGGQINLGVRLSSKVSLSLYGRYLHAFNSSDKRTIAVSDGWTAEPTEYHTDRFTAGVALSFDINHETRLSGDNCWQGGVYSGYSFSGNEGVVLGAELLHFKRTNARGGAVFGLGSYQIFGDDASTNAIYGQAGYRVLPKGSRSIVEIELGVKAGLGEYAKKTCSKTEDNSLQTYADGYAIGALIKAYAGVNFHFGRHQIKLAGDFGGHYNFGADFEGNRGYDGKADNGFGSDAAVTVGYAFSF